MTSNEIKKTVEEKKNQITILESEIYELQESCIHEETHIKSVSNSVSDLRKLCKVCSIELGYPSKEELKNAGYI